MKHSAWNLVITAVGFVLGAINVLVLATTYLDDEYYGLWGYILSTAFLIFPLMSFGIHNTIIKYYSKYPTKEERDVFLTQMLCWPLGVVLFIVGLIWIFQTELQLFISSRNQMVGDYLWLIVVIGFLQAYFEIFYAWVKVHMKTIGGNFLKEVFYRFGATILLLLVMWEQITQVQFIYALALIYLLRMLLMMWLALKTYRPQWRWGRLQARKDILTYSMLMIVAGSVATALLDLDKNMINQFRDIELISYFNVAVFVATVIAVPARGMAQITHPLTATHYNNNDRAAMEDLYKRSSLNLSIISGFLMVIILCNAQEFYQLLPPAFEVGIPVLFLISVVKYTENLLGSNNAILYNTDLYRVTLWMGLGLALLAFLLNLWLIPLYGIIGAAVATCAAYVGYAAAKIGYVNYKLGMHPWTSKTTASVLLILISLGTFYFWDFPWNPYINIGAKSLLICLYYGILMYYFNLSTEINAIILQLWHKKSRFL
ncbi:lipopolysaccharide biosynthesis protein [Nonlabens xiamenensis]|uniref:lipopolysaccharide biosynthesis protein n=1 Tax=Nonlabens xiamenensis TaxID=2341043 RepID=UPI001F0CCBC7|nr:lipopolysaccharide biosynthesis protein [Nonlabens xiamenensis]